MAWQRPPRSRQHPLGLPELNTEERAEGCEAQQRPGGHICRNPVTITPLFHGWAETSSITAASAEEMNTGNEQRVAKDNGEPKVTSCHTVNFSLCQARCATEMASSLLRRWEGIFSGTNTKQILPGRAISLQENHICCNNEKLHHGTVDKSNCCCSRQASAHCLSHIQ